MDEQMVLVSQLSIGRYYIISDHLPLSGLPFCKTMYFINQQQHIACSRRADLNQAKNMLIQT